MGVKSFTQVFDSSSEVTYKDFKGKNIAIDASVEIYRSALGMKISETLTDAFGQPTAHINIILLGVILKLKAANANQYWVFDKFHTDGEDCHNPLKQLELQKRKEKKMAASKKIIELKKEIEKLNISTEESELFSDSEGEEEIKSNQIIKHDQIIKHKENLDKQEKVAFVIKRSYFEDVIFMLDMLDIPWLECPAGFDAEQVAAEATNKNIFGVRMDFVLSSDMDTLLFGAKALIKRDIKKKKFFKYILDELLENYELEQDDLIKVGLILGTDFAPKTPKVGPKTVLKKYKSIELTEDQQKAMDLNFKRRLNNDEIKNIVIKNKDLVPFTDMDKYQLLLDWLQKVKQFNRERIMKLFAKQKLFE